MDIQGKVALVTGAASGIGRASALALAERGADVVFLADLDGVGLEETAELVKAAGGRPFAHETDVTDVTSQRALFARIVDDAGHVDIVHNNAGVASGVPQFPEMALERIVTIVDVNLKGVMLGTTLAVEAMRGRGGAVVNTASIAADVIERSEAIYGTTKAGVVHFTKCCAALAETHKVRVNCVLPGVVDTPMLASAPWLESMLQGIPLLRPSDIAAAVIDLVEDDAKAGQSVTVMNDLSGIDLSSIEFGNH